MFVPTADRARGGGGWLGGGRNTPSAAVTALPVDASCSFRQDRCSSRRTFRVCRSGTAFLKSSELGDRRKKDGVMALGPQKRGKRLLAAGATVVVTAAAAAAMGKAEQAKFSTAGLLVVVVAVLNIAFLISPY